uniref:C-type lectin domain-containing protein n=1 Tax=Panagrolaimus davidi TaxID=227884 RepID=A0A914R2Y1_9BILA
MFLNVFTYFLFVFVSSCFADCPDGWTFWNENCYKVYENSNWKDAESQCQLGSAHLTSIHSHDEILFVADLMNHPGAEACSAPPQGWIGLHSEDNFTSWKWIDGTPTDYQYWYPTQPNRIGNCTYMHIAPICSNKIGMFANSIGCNEKLAKFVCKKKSTESNESKLATIPKSITSEPSYCIEGWTFWNGKCYGVFYDANWYVAEAHCSDYGAHLASINSHEENLFIADLAQHPGATACASDPQGWIGLFRYENEWYWSDETPAEYLNWFPNQPQKDAGNVCVYMHLAPICNGKMGKFANAVPCDKVLKKYICKKDPEQKDDEKAKIIVPKTITLVSKKESCPDGWTFWNENCYKLYENSNWFDAESQCKLGSAHLASIHSHDENLFLADLMNHPGADACSAPPQGWIGLYTDDDFKSMKWSDGTPIDYQYWHPNQPILAAYAGNCIYMHIAPICGNKIGMFANSIRCNEKLAKFVCKKKPLQNNNKIAVSDPVVLTPKLNDCLNGWSFWNGSCYKVFENANWFEAEKQCKMHHAHLASIHSVEENLYLADLAEHPDHACAVAPQGWIGLIREKNEWKWADGTSATNLNWFTGQPQKEAANNCAYMHLAPICNGKMGKLANAALCDQVLKKFICKTTPSKSAELIMEQPKEVELPKVIT